MKLNTVIDKDYVPQVGDILSNDNHPLVTIEIVYYLNRTSLRVNKNYYDQLFKFEALKKIIQRKEIIWNQHKNDLRLFPNNIPLDSVLNQDTFLKRDVIPYYNYCYYNDLKQYKRLYVSKYSSLPQRKQRIVIGQKTMVRVNHGLCSMPAPEENKRYYPTGMMGCNYWYGKHATPLSYLVNQSFIYRGNIFTMIENYES